MPRYFAATSGLTYGSNVSVANDESDIETYSSKNDGLWLRQPASPDASFGRPGMSIEVWFWSSIVCLRFLAESLCADGRGFSHRSSEASRRATLTGSSPVCIIRRKTKAKQPPPLDLRSGEFVFRCMFVGMSEVVRAGHGVWRER